MVAQGTFTGPHLHRPVFPSLFMPNMHLQPTAPVVDNIVNNSPKDTPDIRLSVQPTQTSPCAAVHSSAIPKHMDLDSGKRERQDSNAESEQSSESMDIKPSLDVLVQYMQNFSRATEGHWPGRNASVSSAEGSHSTRASIDTPSFSSPDGPPLLSPTPLSQLSRKGSIENLAQSSTEIPDSTNPCRLPGIEILSGSLLNRSHGRVGPPLSYPGALEAAGISVATSSPPISMVTTSSPITHLRPYSMIQNHMLRQSVLDSRRRSGQSPSPVTPEANSSTIEVDAALFTRDKEENDREKQSHTDMIVDTLVKEGRLHRCDHCNILFPEYSLFILHRGCHGNQAPYQCHFCQTVFAEKFGFLAHFMQCTQR